MMQNCRHCPLILAMFLLANSALAILPLYFDYRFVLYHAPTYTWFAVAVMLVLTVLGVINDGSEISNVSGPILPLIANLFVIANPVTILGIQSNTESILFLAIISITCSIILFFKCKGDTGYKIIAGCLAGLLLIPILYFGPFLLLFGSIGEDTVVRELVSPNSTHTAYLIKSDQGALGGDTFVEVAYNNNRFNLLIGELAKNNQQVYSGPWGEFDTMIMKWKTDDILLLNGEEYGIGQ